MDCARAHAAWVARLREGAPVLETARLRLQVPTSEGLRDCQVQVWRDQDGPALAGSIKVTTYPPTAEGATAQMKVQHSRST